MESWALGCEAVAVTVAELIAKLQEMPQDAQIFSVDDWGSHYEWEPQVKVWLDSCLDGVSGVEIA